MNLVHFHRFSPHMVHDTTRCSYNNLHPAFQRSNLLYNFLAAINRKNFNAMHIFCQTADFLCYLYSQFPCGAQDNTLRLFFLRIDFLQQGNSKGCGLARTGLGLSGVGVIFCCTIILIPVGIGIIKAGIRMILPG